MKIRNAAGVKSHAEKTHAFFDCPDSTPFTMVKQKFTTLLEKAQEAQEAVKSHKEPMARLVNMPRTTRSEKKEFANELSTLRKDQTKLKKAVASLRENYPEEAREFTPVYVIPKIFKPTSWKGVRAEKGLKEIVTGDELLNAEQHEPQDAGGAATKETKPEPEAEEPEAKEEEKEEMRPAEEEEEEKEEVRPAEAPMTPMTPMTPMSPIIETTEEDTDTDTEQLENDDYLRIFALVSTYQGSSADDMQMVNLRSEMRAQGRPVPQPSDYERFITPRMRASGAYLGQAFTRLQDMVREENPDTAANIGMMPLFDIQDATKQLRDPVHVLFAQYVTAQMREFEQGKNLTPLTESQQLAFQFSEVYVPQADTEALDEEQAAEESALVGGYAQPTQDEVDEHREIAERIARELNLSMPDTSRAADIVDGVEIEGVHHEIPMGEVFTEYDEGGEGEPMDAPPPMPEAATRGEKAGAPERVVRDLDRSQPAPGMAGASQALAALGGKPNEAEMQRVEKMTIGEAKARIEALHKAYDGLIPALTDPMHKKNKDRAMKSKRPQDAKAHLRQMLQTIREYFAGPMGGLTVGVVIPAQDYLNALMGSMGKGGDCGCHHDKGADHSHESRKIVKGVLEGKKTPKDVREPMGNTEAGKPHPGDVLKDRHGQDSFGRAFSVANHYRNSGMDRSKGVAGYQARTEYDEPEFARPAEPQASGFNGGRDQVRYYAQRRPRGMIRGIRIPT